MNSKGRRKPAIAELRKRAKRIKLVLTDNDGVLTDTGVYYSESGEAFKRFSIRDGMGVELLRKAGIETAIITSEQSPSVRRRAEKLKMPYLFLGAVDKRAQLDAVHQETSLPINSMAYIGDDVNDIGIMETIAADGLTACPSDAMPVVRAIAHYRCAARGGHGAFRDFAEWILRLRGASITDYRY